MTRPRRAVSLAVGALLVTTLAACGRTSTPQPVTAGAPTQAPAAPTADQGGALPTLPPIQQRSPEMFDPNGCRKVTAEQASCASTAGELDAATAAEGPDGTRTLAGFVGKHWSTATPTGTVTVLESTVNASASPDGKWRALGLVRNETAAVVSSATVTAELVGRDGNVLETVRGDAEVRALRTGEPAPFVLSSETTPAAAVASVRWSAGAAAGVGAPSTRAVELRTFWSRLPGDARRVDVGQHHDPESGPLPLVLFGSTTNQGTADLSSPHVVLAWFDPAGRVAAVRDVPGTDDVGPTRVLPVGGAADFVAVVDAPDATAIAPEGLATPTMWGAGS